MACLPEDVRALAGMLPEVVEGAHQGHPDFRVGGRIFATLWTEEARVVVRLTPETQADLLDAEPDVFEAVPGTWGARGWTSLDLDSAEEEILRDVLLTAWRVVAPPGLVARYEGLARDPRPAVSSSGPALPGRCSRHIPSSRRRTAGCRRP